MTKTEAINKVRKLRRLASKNSSSHEARSANETADQLCVKHNISKSDMDFETKAEAFDDLLSRLDSYAKSHEGIPAAVQEVVSKLKGNMSTADKVSSLEKVVGTVRIASFFMGSKGLGPVKQIIEETLTKHGITV